MKGMEAHSVAIGVPSALRKVRKVLRQAGFPLGKVIGRYLPFGPAQKIVPGWNAHRVGASDTIALLYRSPDYRSKADKGPVLDLLRANDMPFDDRGWLDCGGRVSSG